MALLGSLIGEVKPREKKSTTLIKPRSNLQPVAGVTISSLPPNLFSTAIETQDVLPEDSRVGIRRGYTHVSTLVRACARREVIANLHTDNIIRPARSGDRVVWALGRAAERHVRKQILKAKNNKFVYGKWVCRCEHFSHVGMVPKADLCPKCETPRDRFLEHPIFDDEAWIVGNCDMPIMYGDYLVVMEVKSIKRDGFIELLGPLGDHALQALIYRDLYQRKGWKVHNMVTIMYVCKDYPDRKMRSIYREFQVDGTSESAINMVRIAREEALKIKQGLIEKVPPERTLCANIHAPAAKDCPVASLCFNL